MSELIYCPFCGNDNVEMESDGHGGWWFFCHKCRADVHMPFIPERRREQCVEQWNTRHADAAKDKKIAGLMSCLATVESFCEHQRDYYANREQTDIPELKLLDGLMIGWCDYIIGTINPHVKKKVQNDD